MQKFLGDSAQRFTVEQNASQNFKFSETYENHELYRCKVNQTLKIIIKNHKTASLAIASYCRGWSKCLG